MIYIGIDPGTHTGFAVWDGSRFIELMTIPIHTAMWKVWDYDNRHPNEVEVVFEDARQRTWFGEGNTNAKLQGAGSVKRDCSIWEDFCTDYEIPFRAVPPVKGATKVSPEYFKMIANWTARTSQHSRDAGMLVIGRR